MSKENVPLDMATPSQSHLNSLHTLETKIGKAKKRISEEQRRRDENVEEYLKMAAVAQRNQLPQVKALFEKRNTKAATRIAVLQGKLERYQRDLQDLELGAKLAAESSPSKLAKAAGCSNATPGEGQNHGSDVSESSNASKASRGRLLNVGQGIKSVSGNLKDGISGISGTVISKPREIASHLFKQKFGSADNIPHLLKSEEGGSAGHYHHGSAQIPSAEARAHNNSGIVNPNSSLPVGAGGGGAEEAVGGSECSVSAQSSSAGHEAKLNSTSAAVQADLSALIQHFTELKDELSNLREEYDSFKNQAAGDSSFLCQGLQEERFRAERLEEQVNDLTELHQAETGNLKQALADAEEKLSYQSEERLRDMAEMLDACMTKISRLEQQQQQLVTIEGIENSAARALVVKLVNIGLTVLQLLLLIVATAASTLAPFMGSRIRLFATLLIAFAAFLAHRKWPQVMEAVVDMWTEFLNRL